MVISTHSMDDLSANKLPSVQYLVRRQKFIKRNPDFIKNGKLARLTARHLLIQDLTEDDVDNWLVQNPRELNEGEKKLYVGNKIFEELPTQEAAAYSERVKSNNIEQFKSKECSRSEEIDAELSHSTAYRSTIATDIQHRSRKSFEGSIGEDSGSLECTLWL